MNSDLHQQLTANFAQIRASAEFSSDQLWLTFYLCASADHMRPVIEALAAQGWIGLEGWDEGFAYPKVQIDHSLSAVIATSDMAMKLCSEHGVALLNIDADSSPDVTRSRFNMLYQLD